MSTVIESVDYDIYKKGFKSRGVYTEEQAENLFYKVLSEKGLMDTFDLSLSTSDQSLMLEAVKAFSVLLTHTIDDKRDSIWLQTANDLTQAYQAVRFFDYSIIRKKAPMIKIRYRGADTKILHRGDVIGSYKGYDLICMQDLMYLEYGVERTFVLGKWTERDITLVKDSLGDYLLEVTPTVLSSVDNEYLFVKHYATDTVLSSTKHIQDFVKGFAYRDFSIDTSSTELYISNEDKKYGLYDITKQGLDLKVSYVETDGLIGVTSINVGELELTEEYNGKLDSAKVIYYGYNGDTLETLQRHAPLVSATGGKAHSIRDYQILFNAIPEIKSCNPFKDRGIGAKTKYTITDTNLETKITIDVTEFTITNTLSGLQRFSERVMLNIPAYRVEVLSATEFTIQAENAVMTVAVKDLANLTFEELSPAVAPLCCTLLVPYLKKSYIDGTDIDNIFIEGEEIKVSEATDRFKGWNAEPRFYPATRFDINLELSVILNPEINDKAEFETKVQELVSSYSYKIRAVVPIQEIVTKIGQLEKSIDWDLNQKLVTTCILNNNLNRYYFMKQDEYPVITVTIDYEE